MSIQQLQAYSYVNKANGAVATRAVGGSNGYAEVANGGNQSAQNDRSVSLSAQGRSYAASDSVYQMDMGQGATDVDLATYFTHQPNTYRPLSSDGVMMPTARNVATLQGAYIKGFSRISRRKWYPGSARQNHL